MSSEGPSTLVIDFGGQYGHLIARRLRELGRYAYHLPAARLAPDQLSGAVSGRKGIVLSGGPGSVWEEEHDAIARAALASGASVLGICYGHQLLAHVLGGKVGPSPRPEFGPTLVEIIDGASPLTRGLPRRLRVWMSHYDAVLRPPPRARVLARSQGSPVAAMELPGGVYGVQWHPEVRHTEHGMRLLENWLEQAGAEKDWDSGRILELVRRDLASQLEGMPSGARLIAAVSGGVDSTVAVYAVSKLAGASVEAVMIDHGLHPEGWVEETVPLLEDAGIRVRVLDESSLFLNTLKGVADPEEKRRVVSKLYFEVLRREVERSGAWGLVQGTIYPDIIESGGLPGADRIKTHHNLGLRGILRARIVEPLRWLYKDEVRLLGRILGVPEPLLERQPVPGPGLAVRIEGEVTPEKLRIARAADRIVREVIESHGLDKGLWQYFAVVTRSMATGVRGDRRYYGAVVAIRAVESSDAMTASIARLPWSVLEEIASRIASEVPGVSRVVYDITSKPPATIEWE